MTGALPGIWPRHCQPAMPVSSNVAIYDLGRLKYCKEAIHERPRSGFTSQRTSLVAHFRTPTYPPTPLIPLSSLHFHMFRSPHFPYPTIDNPSLPPPITQLSFRKAPSHYMSIYLSFPNWRNKCIGL